MIVVSVGALGQARYTFQVPKSAHLVKSGLQTIRMSHLLVVTPGNAVLLKLIND